MAPEQLWRQRAPQPLARLSAIDPAIVACAFERIAHRRGQNGTDRIAAANLQQPVQIGQRQVGPGRIVHQHKVIGAHAIG